MAGDTRTGRSVRFAYCQFLYRGPAVGPVSSDTRKGQHQHHRENEGELGSLRVRAVPTNSLKKWAPQLRFELNEDNLKGFVAQIFRKVHNRLVRQNLSRFQFCIL